MRCSRSKSDIEKVKWCQGQKKTHGILVSLGWVYSSIDKQTSSLSSSLLYKGEAQ